MKPTDTKPKSTPKTEPAKSSQTTVPKSTTATSKSTTATSKSTTATSKSTTATSSTVKPSTEKVSIKQEAKAAAPKQKSDTTVTSGAVGKAAAASVVAKSKPKDEAKEEKKTVSVEQIAAAPATSERDDALDLLIDSLGGPDDVPETPKFTGPEIAETPAIQEHVEVPGKHEGSIPPKYRHLLDGKGEKPTPPPPEEGKKKSVGDDDLVAAFSSDFVSSPAPPEEKKPKLEEVAPRDKQAKSDVVVPSSASSVQAATAPSKTQAKPTSSAPAAPAQPSDVALPEDALDELMGTLEGPPTTEPESPQFTGPVVTETVTQTYVEELGKRDHTIPPEYRHLLDGKDHGKPVPPPVEQPSPISDFSLVDEFSKDFETCISPPAETTPALQPKVAPQDKQAKSDVVVPSSASSVQAATAPSAGMESALDELMGTLEGSEFSAPESPVYTGPEVMETRTATHIEKLGDRDSTIPPAYRHLLDGKEDGKPVPAPIPEEKPMSESELLDAFDQEFACPQPSAAQQTPPVAPKDAAVVKKSEADVVAVCSSSSSALQAAPAPSKAAAGKPDPLDALSETLGTRKEDPKDKKPAADKVKEKTSKGNKEKLGEDEETIPPDYRLKEVKDKDGKPLLPKPEEKSKPMSEDELLDALTKGFDTDPVPAQCAPLQSSAKAPGKSEEIVSCSKASAVQSSAAAKPSASIPEDALDLLSGSLGERQPDPDENKPVVDVVKERMKEEHITKPGETDGSIPPEYRHLLDGKDQGKPAKPEATKPKKSLDDAAAIDLLSSGFASCDTGTTDKTQNSSKGKVEKSCSSTPVSQTSGKVSESSKDKVEKSSSLQKTETSGKVPDSSKSSSSLEKPSAQKSSKS